MAWARTAADRETDLEWETAKEWETVQEWIARLTIPIAQWARAAIISATTTAVNSIFHRPAIWARDLVPAEVSAPAPAVPALAEVSALAPVVITTTDLWGMVVDLETAASTSPIGIASGSVSGSAALISASSRRRTSPSISASSCPTPIICRWFRVPSGRYYPQFRGYLYFVDADGDVVIVSPRSHRIIAIL